MIRNLRIIRPSIVSIFPLTAIFFVFLNGETTFSRLGSRESWFGWPFIYYGDGGPGSLDLIIYAFPMILDLIIDLSISIIFIFIAKKLIGDRLFVIRGIIKILNALSISSLFIFLFLLFGLSRNIYCAVGPRDRWEISDSIVIGPRFSLNPT